jgi:hypothetical protein
MPPTGLVIGNVYFDHSTFAELAGDLKLARGLSIIRKFSTSTMVKCGEKTVKDLGPLL